MFEGDALPPPPPEEGDSEEEEPAQDWAAGPAAGSVGEAGASGTDDSGAESDDSEGKPWCRLHISSDIRSSVLKVQTWAGRNMASVVFHR